MRTGSSEILRRHQCIAVHWNGDSLNLFDPLTISSSSPPMINLLSQKHDRVTCATKQIRRDSKDTDATKGLVFTTWHFWRVWYYTKSNSVYQSIHAYVHLSDTLLYCHWVTMSCFHNSLTVLVVLIKSLARSSISCTSYVKFVGEADQNLIYIWNSL